MKLSPEHQAELLAATREVAHTLLDDLKHIREFVSKFDKSDENDADGDIRRMSVLLRRILLDNDLKTVAYPRVGNLMILGPQNNPAYKAERTRPFLFFMTGYYSTLVAYDMGIQLKRRALRPLELPNIGEPTAVELTIGSFNVQRILCYRTKWVTREAVIRHIAHLTGGAHSNNPSTPEEILLAQIRNAGTITKEPGNKYKIDLFRNGIDNDVSDFQIGPPGLNPLLIEVFSAAKWLVNSPSILDLEKILKKELGL